MTYVVCLPFLGATIRKDGDVSGQLFYQDVSQRDRTQRWWRRALVVFYTMLGCAMGGVVALQFVPLAQRQMVLIAVGVLIGCAAAVIAVVGGTQWIGGWVQVTEQRSAAGPTHS